MLNSFQHLVKFICEETLNQVQGDRNILFEQSINGVGGINLQDYLDFHL